MGKREKREKLTEKIDKAKSKGGHQGLKERIEAIEEYLNLDIKGGR